MEVLKQSGLPGPRIGGPSAAPFDLAQDKLRTGVGAAPLIIFHLLSMGKKLVGALTAMLLCL